VPPAPVDGGVRDATPIACAENSACDDRLFCNGAERCAADFCVAGTAPCVSGQRCDEFDDACRPCTDADADGDGSSSCEGDCDDADSTRYPGASEVCDAVDEDCNDTTFGRDDDSDGFESSACCNGPGLCGLDCNDLLNIVNPRAAESCNGIDDDCNGLADALDGVCLPCGAGYRGTTPDCMDIDECAEGIAACDQDPVAPCENQSGTFLCRCPSGYEGDGRGGAGCAEIDECARDLDDCDIDPVAACTNSAGAFSCACPVGFVGVGRGADGCLFDDPALFGLVAGPTGTLDTPFDPATTSYVLTLGAGATAVTLTPSVSMPARASIVADGATAASGVPIDVATAGLGARIIDIVVTTESGASRTYRVTIVRRGTYFKASGSGANDEFGYAVALSTDGNTLAVGARGERSGADGIGGSETDNTEIDAGAVYVFVRGPSGWTQQA